MGFSEKQVNALRRSLSEGYIRTREVQGRTLSYIEGWHAIAEANRIFGFDGWDRETVESKCVIGRDTRGAYHAVYLARVRITVRAEGRTVVREGFGSGEAQGSGAGETHERALKTAETDATKRALATFGKPFGLSLYVTPRNGRDHGVSNPLPGAPPIAERDRRRTQQRVGRNGRYFVPRRSPVILDPTLAADMRSATPAMARAPTGAPSVPLGPVEARKLDQTPTLGQVVPLQPGQIDEALSGPTDARTLDQAPMLDQTTMPSSQKPDQGGEAMSQSTGVSTLTQSGSDGQAAVAAKGSSTSAQAPGEIDSPALLPPGEVPAPPLEALRPAPEVEAEFETEFDEPRLLIEWPKRRRDPEHLRYVRTQPCLICSRTPSDAHHLKFTQPRGLKVSDEFTVPLCRVHHDQLHRAGKELNWWSTMDRDVDPLQIAKGLWEESRLKLAAGEQPNTETANGSAPPRR